MFCRWSNIFQLSNVSTAHLFEQTCTMRHQNDQKTCWNCTNEYLVGLWFVNPKLEVKTMTLYKSRKLYAD